MGLLSSDSVSAPERKRSSACLRLPWQATGRLLAAADCPEDKKAGYQTNLEYVQWNLSTLKADDAEEKAKKMLRGLGFKDAEFERKAREDEQGDAHQCER